MDTKRKMSRRTALKQMGAAALGFAVASTGLFPLSACKEKKKSRVVLYFTGTGNSLYIARQLAGEQGKVLSIPQLVKENKYDIEADEIGIVYPVYGQMPPYMVRQFIQKARLKADYKFAVLTYGGGKGSAVEIWDDISKKAGNEFQYIGTIVMVDNWLPNFDMNEEVKKEKHVPENLAKISGDIAGQKHWHEPVSDEERAMHAAFMARTGLDPEKGFLMRSEKYFTVTDACVGCGACIALCPRGNYAYAGEVVSMQGDCDFCFACIQNCPQKAIQFAPNEGDPFLSNGEKNPNARYRNEHVSMMDIKNANNQH